MEQADPRCGLQGAFILYSRTASQALPARALAGRLPPQEQAAAGAVLSGSFIQQVPTDAVAG